MKRFKNKVGGLIFMETDQEKNGHKKNTELESRITAGTITNLVAREFVQREGFVIIYNYIEKISENEYRKFFNFGLDNGEYYVEISDCVEGHNCYLHLNKLNIGLYEDFLYIAHFKPILPVAPLNIRSLYNNARGTFNIYGTGDLYSDKEITVDETGRVKELAISGI